MACVLMRTESKQTAISRWSGQSGGAITQFITSQFHNIKKPRRV